MKKLGVICSLLSYFAIYSSNAQTIPNKKSYLKFPKVLISQLSVQVGPIFSYPIVIKDPGKDRAVDIGVAAIISVSHKFTDCLSLALSASYEQKGYEAAYHYVNESVIPNREEKAVLTSKLQYASGSVISRFTPLSKIPLYVGIGPYISHLLKSQGVTEIYSLGKLISKQTTTQNPSGYIDTDFGLSACIGYSIPLNARLFIAVEAKYSRGLTTINKSYISELTNNAFDIVVGLSLKK